MSGGNANAAPAGATAAPRRRTDRPATVPLSEFGKEAPPPPRQRLTRQQIVISALATVVTLALLWFILIWAGGMANGRWSKTGCLDARAKAAGQC
ncbi:MAG TPA: hypothetical protein VNM48_15350 [Chloroflexota bacterium]|nr:hypothetical protein [Chloroflexota bacterium]